MVNFNPDLIEYVAQKCDCTYISDLHEKAVLSKLKCAVADDKLLSYPLGQWRNFAEYLTGVKPASDDKLQIRQYILEEL